VIKSNFLSWAIRPVSQTQSHMHTHAENVIFTDIFASSTFTENFGANGGTVFSAYSPVAFHGTNVLVKNRGPAIRVSNMLMSSICYTDCYDIDRHCHLHCHFMDMWNLMATMLRTMMVVHST